MSLERFDFRQRGAGLPVALFIITVLSLLVAGMAQLQESSGRSIGQQILSQRAFYAAESGAQVAVAQVLDGGNCSAVSSSVSFSVSGLNGCQSSLSCGTPVTADIDGDGADETVFTLRSDGQCGTGDETATRSVEVRVR